MENKLKINSCSQKWENMMPTACGRFCNACQKEVIDFRQMDVQEILNVHQSKKGKVCGIYKLGQVDIEKTIFPKPISMQAWKAWYIGLLGIFFAEPISAQEVSDSTKVEQLETTKEGIRIGNKIHSYHGGLIKELDSKTLVDTFTVKGLVTAVDGEPLIGASILIEGENEGTVTDIDGVFELEIEPIDALREKVRLKVSYTGFETKIILIPNNTKSIIDDLRIELEEEVLGGTDFIVVGGVFHSTWTQRAWYKIRRFFSFQWL